MGILGGGGLLSRSTTPIRQARSRVERLIQCTPAGANGVELRGPACLQRGELLLGSSEARLELALARVAVEAAGDEQGRGFFDRRRLACARALFLESVRVLRARGCELGLGARSFLAQ